MSLLWFFWCIGHIILMALMVFMTHPFYGYVEDTPFYGSFVVYDTPLLWFFLCRRHTRFWFIRHTPFMVPLVYKAHPFYGSYSV